MKKIIGLIFILNLSTAVTGLTQGIGKVIEDKVMVSKITKSGLKYVVYLPADYYTSERRYPVVYLLHGYSDSESAWVQFGNVNQTADKAIAAGEITPMIIVMPYGGIGWYINSYDGKNLFMDSFIKEFVPHIDATYRTRASREYRAVSGLSMGGFGALIDCLKYPDVFSVCAALSSGVFTDQEIEKMDEATYNRLFSNIYAPTGTKGADRLNAYWKENSIINLVKTLPKEQLQKVQWYIDCGDEDFLTIGNAMLHVAFREREVPHQYRVRDGSHNWGYWRSGIYDALKFITPAFDRR